MYHTQGSRCIKCNKPYKIKHYKHFAWYYKANFKINLPQLETKQEESYFYSFQVFEL